MHVRKRRIAKLALICALGLGGATGLALIEPPARAQAENAQRGVYIIPAGGYGVDECVATSAECGRVVATAWCEAHGHGRVVAFGSASDITFSANVSVKTPPRDSVIITCSD